MDASYNTVIEQENTEECIDLKNIQYKTMFYHNTILPSHINSSDSISNLDKFLESEIKQSNSSEQNWNKLNKTMKLKKLLDYADTISKERNYDNNEKQTLILFFRSCLDSKRLQSIKQVSYDPKTGNIKDVPVLLYNKTNRHFTLRNIDKQHHSTLKLINKPLTKTLDIKD